MLGRRLLFCVALAVTVLLYACADDGERDNPTDPMASNYVVPGDSSDVTGEDYQSKAGDESLSSSSKKTGSSSSKVVSSSGMVRFGGCNRDGKDSCEYGTLVDSRDGNTYKTVRIGTQNWMAENLNYEPPEMYYEGYESYCYEDSADSCKKYGRLYTWKAAMYGSCFEDSDDEYCKPKYPAKGLCPKGWHIPTKAEWDILLKFVGGEVTAGLLLKANEGWKNNTGMNAYGFSVIPAGLRTQSGAFSDPGLSASFWTSTENTFNQAYSIYFTYYSESAEMDGLKFKSNAYSARCIEDVGDVSSSSTSSESSSSSVAIDIEVVPPCNVDGEDNCEYGKLTDSRDGAVYKTVVIGEQRWMAENLDYAESGSQKLSVYGRAYTWAMAMDSVGRYSEEGLGCGAGGACKVGVVRGICPEGWLLPDSVAWAKLVYSVGGPSVAGKNLKRNAANSYGFSAELAGTVNFRGEIVNAGTQASFWGSSDVKYNAYRLGLSSSDDKVPLRGDSDKENLLPVRCFQDASTPAENDSSPTESGEE